MNTRTLKSFAVAAVALTTLAFISFAASAAPLIYEPFDYSNSDLSANTQTGLGLSGNWGDSGTLVASPGITYGVLATAGNKVTMSDDSSWAGTGTTLNTSLDNGDTLWFSVLVTPGDVGTNPDFGFALGTDRGLDSNNVPLATANGGNGLGFRIKGGIKATAWSGGGASTASGVSASGGTTYLVVGEMIFGATDTINLYLPDTNLNLGSVVSTQTATLDQTAFDMITFMDKSATPRDEADEIRFGTTYADVTPVISYEWGGSGGSWDDSNWDNGTSLVDWPAPIIASFPDAETASVTVDSPTNVAGMVFATGSNYTIGGGSTLTFTRAGNITTNGTAATILSAGLAGTVDVTKDGAGLLAITGDTQVYTGTMTVSGTGTLDLNPSTVFNGDVVVENGAHLATNEGGIGSLNLNGGTLTLEGGAILDIDIAGTTADSFGAAGDTLTVSGGAGPVILNLFGAGIKGSSYTIFGGTVTAFNESNFLVTGLPGNWTVSEGSLVLTLVPEPSTIVLAGLGLAGLTIRRRRK